MGTTAIFANEADRVGIINHHQRIVFVRQVADAFQIGNHTVHWEHAVGGNQHVTCAGCTRFLQALFQLNHVVVGIAETLRFTQAHAVDDRGMVQGVGDNGVFCAQQRFKQAAVGIKTGGIQNGVFHTEEACQLLLQRFVAVLGTADETHRRHAETMAVHTGFGGIDQLRVVGQAKVVVGAEVNDVAAVAHGDIRLLGGGDDTFFFKQPFRTSGVEVLS